MRKPSTRFRPQLEALEGRCLPSTLTVTSTADSGPASLRYEIAGAKNKDTIVFAPSLNGQTITLTSGELDITKNLTIQGPGAGQLTISGGGSSRVFEVASKNNVTVSGLMISNGHATDGGGIYVDSGGTLTISNSTVSGNSSTVYGGAVFNSGTLTISNSTVSSNTATDAGGAIENAGANVTISGCTLSGNSVGFGGYGGAIRNDNGGNLSISNSTLSGNSAPGGEGGAIFSLGGSTLTLTDCTLSSNTAYDGGAVYNMGTMTVSGCTFSSNIANDTGGAIYNYHNSLGVGGVLTVNNSVFSSNTPDNIFGNYSGSGNTFK
jgi:predicted outer membrane repeat protein